MESVQSLFANSFEEKFINHLHSEFSKAIVTLKNDVSEQSKLTLTN